MSGLWNGLQSLLGGIVAFFYGLVPNLGIAIILLTLVVGLVLFPLTLKQTRSMRAMQEIQPKVKKLQAEYKHDRQLLQEKTMELYREKGVNPAAGCFPILLQMPIWFALFSVLRSFASGDPTRFVPQGSELFLAIEQKVADTTSTVLDFLWMDLTITPRDAFAISFLDSVPYLITIALVMVTAYVQQKQTMARSASQRDPNAAAPPGMAIMKIFPLFFGFISFTLPAGLVVYFAASQLFRIAQQAVIIGMDDRAEEEADEEAGSESAPAAKDDTPPAPKKPASKGDGDQPKGQAPRVNRRPQGSKKKRGKRRRR
ncbi:MAG: YidC/Oxa1 family membrane protein insertase [Acidimicrobiia bacterium]|nr:YidC/Oxa1 family membrane protein insertase [Acidimicrobiia bacterium]